MINLNCHYIYGWFNLITQQYFYIGAGKHQKNSRYDRAYEKHYYGTKKLKRKTRAQYKREKIQSNFVVHILADNLNLYERHMIEQLYISVYETIDHTGILYNHTKGGDYNPMFDEDVKKKHAEICRSDSHIEKHKNRIEIEFDDIIYKSKKQLARFLGISSQLLNYRLDNNIQLDLIPDKTYRSKPSIRKNKKEGDL